MSYVDDYKKFIIVCKNFTYR